jgi:hypothetical protein
MHDDMMMHVIMTSYLVDVMVLKDAIKQRVQVVQEGDDLEKSRKTKLVNRDVLEQ